MHKKIVHLISVVLALSVLSIASKYSEEDDFGKEQILNTTIDLNHHHEKADAIQEFEKFVDHQQIEYFMSVGAISILENNMFYKNINNP
ncbi:hypothetical protein [Alkalitalea saponilacus]|uniref:Uncharacterized protein n=1 Tax=Alkalitalea saponilacus TaxID=889453 RepID=A0A1T5FAN9_9BACT|nr:hypothetical protein [Alkalitalea saponilacus]ASB50093.1 hypothetical protein CDL62_13575 [Alkalitalea saponilacus]SKB93229.1 hypothetical protein SAMN03080601_01569 [Alkalitalea saponilacus]